MLLPDHLSNSYRIFSTLGLNLIFANELLTTYYDQTAKYKMGVLSAFANPIIVGIQSPAKVLERLPLMAC